MAGLLIIGATGEDNCRLLLATRCGPNLDRFVWSRALADEDDLPGLRLAPWMPQAGCLLLLCANAAFASERTNELYRALPQPWTKISLNKLSDAGQIGRFKQAVIVSQATEATAAVRRNLDHYWGFVTATGAGYHDAHAEALATLTAALPADGQSAQLRDAWVIAQAAAELHTQRMVKHVLQGLRQIDQREVSGEQWYPAVSQAAVTGVLSSMAYRATVQHALTKGLPEGIAGQALDAHLDALVAHQASFHALAYYAIPTEYHQPGGVSTVAEAGLERALHALDAAHPISDQLLTQVGFGTDLRVGTISIGEPQGYPPRAAGIVEAVGQVARQYSGAGSH